MAHTYAESAHGIVRSVRVNSVLDLIGSTPVVRLNRVIPATSATVWCVSPRARTCASPPRSPNPSTAHSPPRSFSSHRVKLESANPGGSVKDRIALGMVNAAEARGELKQGMRLLEATSGNTGIGLAFVAAAKGYGITLVMPDSMTGERRALLKAYGAELVLTPGPLGMKEAVRVATEMASTDKSFFYVQQFDNKDNVRPGSLRAAGDRVRSTNPASTLTHPTLDDLRSRRCTRPRRPRKS